MFTRAETDKSHSILAMAQAATFYKLVRPRMVEANVIKIKSGR